MLFLISSEFTLSLGFVDGLVWSRKHGHQGQVDTPQLPPFSDASQGGQQHQEQSEAVLVPGAEMALALLTQGHIAPTFSAKLGSPAVVEKL